MKYEVIVAAVVVAVVINLLLPRLVMRMGVTEEQVNPPNGAPLLPFPDQVIHMLVHHAQVPLSSSLVVAVIVGLSVYVACLDDVKKFVSGL